MSTLNWALIIVGIPTALVALGIVGRTLYRFLHASVTLAEAMPTLLTIANVDFAPKKDGTGSLREVVDGIRSDLNAHTATEDRTGVEIKATLDEHTHAIARIETSTGVTAGMAEATAKELAEHREIMQTHIEDDRAAFARIEERQQVQVKADAVAHEAAAQVLHETGVADG